MYYTSSFFFFFFNDTATTEIYTLSLHDALPISRHPDDRGRARHRREPVREAPAHPRSEEHTSELQSRLHLVCRLLLEKKKKKKKNNDTDNNNIINYSQTTIHKQIYTPLITRKII